MPPTDDPLFLGIDLGTSGARVVALAADGALVAQAAVPIDAWAVRLDAECHEQQPRAWWDTLVVALRQLVEKVKQAGRSPDSIRAAAIDGTSGTLVALDAAGSPLRPALMYSDPRGALQAQRLNAAAPEFLAKFGYRFGASFALAKIAWLAEREPEVFARTARFVHQADYILERLTGVQGVSDYSNALKTGYDLVDDRWPAWIEATLAVGDRLPRIVAPGTPVGTLEAEAAAETGLPPGLMLVAGASDGTAACLASGLRRVGDYNTTLGTTLVFKGVSDRLVRDPQGLIYCHKLPGGRWLPGAASSTGGEWVSAWFGNADPVVLDAAAECLLPTDVLAWPLVRTGERFPVFNPAAAGFMKPEPDGEVQRYAACLQGTAFVERLGYERLDEICGTAGGEVYSTGGGSRSDVWMQCRADATGRVMHRPALPESAAGSAILAAAGTHYATLAEATARMVRIERTFLPDPARAGQYQDLYRRWRELAEP